MSGIDKMVFLISCIIEIFLIYDFFQHFFSLKLKKIEMLFSGIFASLALFGVNLLQNAKLNLLLAPLIIWIFLTIAFETNIWIRLGYFLIAYGILLSGEFLVVVITNTTAEILEEIGVISLSEEVWYLLFIRLLNQITFLFIKRILNKTERKSDDKMIFIYYCIPVSTMGIMMTIFYTGIDFEANDILKHLMTIFLIFMVIGNILLILAFEKYVEKMSENASQQMELIYQRAEVERLTKINELNDSHNQLVHNAAHYLKLIGELALEKRDKEILYLVKELCGNLYQGEISTFCDNKILNTILSEYQQKAEGRKISCNFYIEPGCNLRQIQEIDLIVIIGNLLDNGITAAEKENNPMMELRVFRDTRGNYDVIKIVNSFTGELKKGINGLLTTKNEVGIHGIGIKSVIKIVESYNGSFQYYVEDGKFCSICIFPLLKDFV